MTVNREVKTDAIRPVLLSGEEVSESLDISQRQLALYRKMGLIKWVKLNKKYMYKKEWIDEFLDSWIGYDLSNEEQIRLSIELKAWKEKHEG